MLKILHELVISVFLLVNKTKILYGIPRDADVAAALAEMEQAESLMEEDRPKVRQHASRYQGHDYLVEEETEERHCFGQEGEDCSHA